MLLLLYHISSSNIFLLLAALHLIDCNLGGPGHASDGDFLPDFFLGKASTLSAQAAGSDSPPGPSSKKITNFSEGFLAPRVQGFLKELYLGEVFLQRGPGGEPLPAAWSLKIDGF